MNIRFTRPALAELEDTFSYIAEQDPVAAERVIRRIRTAIHVLGLHTHFGRVTSKKDVRILVTVPYRYRVFYTVSENEIVILHVRHSSMSDPD